mgnify:CR=1 FL=1
MNYIKNWKFFSIVYLLFIIEFYYLFSTIYERLFTLINGFSFVITIIVSVLFYSRQNRSDLQHELMSRFDYRYLTVKFIEVTLQQLVILLLFYLTNQNLLVFLSIFVLVHVHLFREKKILSVVTIMLIALLLSLIFFGLYSSFGINGFGLSYAIHMCIYLVGGIVFRRIYR